jgi:hypothetical protein
LTTIYSLAVERAIRQQNLIDENRQLRDQLQHRNGWKNIFVGL